MQMKIWARGCAAVFGIFASASLAFAADNPETKQIGKFNSDDGTYSVQTVTSDADCRALCEADDKCRGTVIYQEDTSKPEIECRLNDGFGTNAAFPRTEPEPIDFDRALSELNAYRRSNGLSDLIYDARLNKASEVHAKDLAAAGILSHTGTDGSSHSDRIQLQGYYFSIAAENAAAGQTSWDSAFKSWKTSKGHNENLLRDDVSEFGLALAYAPETKLSTYWVMLVADPVDIDTIPLAE